MKQFISEFFIFKTVLHLNFTTPRKIYSSENKSQDHLVLVTGGVFLFDLS